MHLGAENYYWMNYGETVLSSVGYILVKHSL